MGTRPIQKLTLPADQAFGPFAGLGPLVSGPLGEMRRLLGPRLDIPVALPAPFLWELHLAVLEEPLLLDVALDGAAAPIAAHLVPGQRCEVLGTVRASLGQPAQRLGFSFAPDPAGAPVWFLGLSILPLGPLLP